MKGKVKRHTSRRYAEYSRSAGFFHQLGLEEVDGKRVKSAPRNSRGHGRDCPHDLTDLMLLS
jgi:hypothetical protein